MPTPPTSTAQQPPQPTRQPAPPTSDAPTAGKPTPDALPDNAPFKERLRAWIDRTREQIREADPVIKKKAGIVSTWAGLSLCALLIAFTPHCGDGGLQTTARLRVQKVESLQQSITAFYLENNGAAPWDKVTLTLNGQYKLLLPTIAPGENEVAQLDKFRSGDISANPNTPLQTLRLDCTAGSVTFDLKTGQPIEE